MKFLIQHNLINQNHLQIIKDSIIDYPHEFIGLIPFTTEITSNEELIGIDFIPYGSTSLTNIAYDKGWKGLHFDLKYFNYEEAVKNRNDMLNNGLIWPLKEIIEFLKTEKEKDWFIRPSEDLKQFSGCIMSTLEIIEWLEDRMLCASSGSYQLDPNTMIVLDKPKNISAEWRWFIVDRKIISGSVYRYNKQLFNKEELDIDVINEAQEFADGWLPDPCCVMDLALIENDLKVIEFNCINSSGFYHHNIKNIFDVLWSYHERN
jgi:hypothetical protein